MDMQTLLWTSQVPPSLFWKIYLILVTLFRKQVRHLLFQWNWLPIMAALGWGQQVSRWTSRDSLSPFSCYFRVSFIPFLTYRSLSALGVVPCAQQAFRELSVLRSLLVTRWLPHILQTLSILRFVLFSHITSVQCNVLDPFSGPGWMTPVPFSKILLVFKKYPLAINHWIRT